MLPLSLKHEIINGFVIAHGVDPNQYEQTEAPKGFCKYRAGNFFAWASEGLGNPLDGLFLGWALHPGTDKIVRGPVGGEQEIANILCNGRPENGKFLLIKSKPEKYIFMGDTFGQMLTFFGENNELKMCGNNLLLLIIFQTAINKKTLIRKEVILSHFISDSALCMHSNSHETVISGISYAMPGSIIHFYRSGKIIEEKEEVDTSQIDDKQYQAALEEAASSLRIVVRALSRDREKIRIDLTAGRDSRLVLGAALAEGLEEQILTSTIPGNLNDNLMAREISQRFGLIWSLPNLHRVDVKLSDPFFTLHRSQSLWINHEVYNDYLGYIKEHSVMHLTGGGGDSLRATFFSQRHAEKPWATASFEFNSIENMLRDQQFSSKWSVQDRNDVAEYFYEEFKRLHGHNILKKLDHHYICHRNRFHFGGANTKDNYLYSAAPLMNGPLLRLSRRMTAEDRLSYKLHKDITGKFNADLASMPYGNDENFPEIIGAFSFDWSELQSSYIERKHKSREAKNKALLDMALGVVPDLLKSDLVGEIVKSTAVPRLNWMRNKRPDHEYLPVWCARLIGLHDVLSLG